MGGPQVPCSTCNVALPRHLPLLWSSLSLSHDTLHTHGQVMTYEAIIRRVRNQKAVASCEPNVCTAVKCIMSSGCQQTVKWHNNDVMGTGAYR